MGRYLGIDTSNYSTSAALFDSDSGTIKMYRKLLPVPEKQIGLRQSDAVFAHTKQLSSVLHEVFKETSDSELSAVGVSVFPRRAEGSYMPCFLVGKMTAEAIAEAGRLPLHTFSHQEGHILAAIYSSGAFELLKAPFLAFHVSGGTTEALLVSPDDEYVIRAECIAKTLDLNAGQLIDRVGVMLGCSFPAGPELEKLAAGWNEPVKVRASLKGHDICLSGIQNQCEAMLKKGETAEKIARFCLESVRVALEKMLAALFEEFGPHPVLFSGGVMSNRLISAKLASKGKCYFAEPSFSSDNAAGIAYLTYLKEQKDE